jgi:bifunctional non-homologous end joining protein LigD
VARFVIQQHDATTLHYDLRLEVDGVLRSWAVPKGPSTDPGAKRLAVEVEDHRLEYADFEGLTGGVRGSGAVIVWDAGSYRNLDLDRSMSEAIADGHVKVWLDGEKLRGGWTLQRTSGGRTPQWLMIKRRDGHAQAGGDPPRTQPISVKSGRTLGQLAKGGSRAEAAIHVGGRTIEITHPSKALFERPTITKLDLARHYERVAEAMLPHVRARPLALEAFPKGIDSPGFFMKSIPKHFPDWIATTNVPKRGGSLTQIQAADAATLVYLAGQNVVTPHVWLSRADELRKPDRLILDFDPSPGVRFADVRAAARDAGDRLRDAGLATFAMVTGSRGIHVVCPLRRGPAFTDVHRFARALAETMVAGDPKHLTLEWHKSERGRRIYVDVNRINYAQHVVAPYGVRARRKGPVAMPIEWDELSDARLKPDGWTIRTAADRLRDQGDAWRGINRRARRLPDDG